MKFEVSMLNVNGVWKPLLIVTCDAEAEFSNPIVNGDTWYYCEPCTAVPGRIDGKMYALTDGKYVYWFTINQTEVHIPDPELKQKVDDLTKQNSALGQQVTTMTISGAQKDTQMKQLGSQLVQMQLDIAKLKGGAAT